MFKIFLEINDVLLECFLFSRFLPGEKEVVVRTKSSIEILVCFHNCPVVEAIPREALWLLLSLALRLKLLSLLPLRLSSWR